MADFDGDGKADILWREPDDRREQRAGSWTAICCSAGSRPWPSLVGWHVAHTATLLPSGWVLVAAGASNTHAEVYDPDTASWSAGDPLPAARRRPSATLLADGRVLIAGGLQGNTSAGTASLYTPSTGTWAGTGPLGGARHAHTATRLPDGRVLVAGGWTLVSGGGAQTRTAEIYDPATASWTTTGSMAAARAYHTATALPGGRVAGRRWRRARSRPGHGRGLRPRHGYLESHRVVPDGAHPARGHAAPRRRRPGDRRERRPDRGGPWDPATGAWGAMPPMHTSHYDHTATLLPDGRVLVAGGSAAEAEVYDPVAATWSITNALAGTRSEHAATLLTDGTVLVTGGATGSAVTAGVYDPASGTWRGRGSRVGRKEDAAAVLLPDGRVVVAGGFDGAVDLATVDVFNPLALSPGRRPEISDATASVSYGSALSVTGTRLGGPSEASGGGTNGCSGGRLPAAARAGARGRPPQLDPACRPGLGSPTTR